MPLWPEVEHSSRHRGQNASAYGGDLHLDELPAPSSRCSCRPRPGIFLDRRGSRGAQPRRPPTIVAAKYSLTGIVFSMSLFGSCAGRTPSPRNAIGDRRSEGPPRLNHVAVETDTCARRESPASSTERSERHQRLNSCGGRPQLSADASRCVNVVGWVGSALQHPVFGRHQPFGIRKNGGTGPPRAVQSRAVRPASTGPSLRGESETGGVSAREPRVVRGSTAVFA